MLFMTLDLQDCEKNIFVALHHCVWIIWYRAFTGIVFLPWSRKVRWEFLFTSKLRRVRHCGCLGRFKTIMRQKLLTISWVNIYVLERRIQVSWRPRLLFWTQVLAKICTERIVCQVSHLFSDWQMAFILSLKYFSCHTLECYVKKELKAA